ncbi:MAG: hypothetical protein C5B50_21570 [Verrucomicrobia bacterium]|nr:MAG: hypothetical protein C5B50_21570 [Verrucomicrobiota bacterium]
MDDAPANYHDHQTGDAEILTEARATGNESKAWGRKVDPLAPPRSVNFPFEEIFSRLDGMETPTGPDWEFIAKAFKQLLLWVNAPLLGRPSRDNLRFTGIRVAAALWVLDPSAFEDGCSMTRLARALGVHKAVLSEYTSAFSRFSGIQNRSQAHARNGQHRKALRTTFRNGQMPRSVEADVRKND